MKTKRLYDENAYLSEFSAVCLDCISADGFFKVVLDKTAFFPNMGGQPSDIGYIGDVFVFDVKFENDEIYHFTKEPLKKGETISCKIDFNRRFLFMQNHTAEHIVSGIINRDYGLENVGFHLSEDFVTCDFSGILNALDLKEIENKANKKVWDNENVRAFYPIKNEIKNLKFRQKKEVDGELRLVEIENCDMCACCAPHVKKTGEIGIIKILSTEKMRGGTRIFMKSGKLALNDYQIKAENIADIDSLLSAKPEETASKVTDFYNKSNEEIRKAATEKRALFSAFSDNLPEDVSLFCLDGTDIKDLQIFADIFYKKKDKTVLLVSKAENAFKFCLAGEEKTAQDLFFELKKALTVKGGGRNGMYSGSIEADYLKIKEFWDKI